jgi:hypothetical protein
MQNTTETLAYIISDEIGSDSVYSRKKKDRLYFTGIEFSLWLGTLLLSSFFLAFLQGVARGAGEKAGEETGKQLIEALGKRLSGIRNKLDGIDTDNTQALKNQVAKYQKELDQVVEDLELVAKTQLIEQNRDSVREMEISEIKQTLMANGFPESKAIVYSERIVFKVTEKWHPWAQK